MWEVYSAKTTYRTSASGKPKFTDSNFRDNIDLIEERVFTLKARSFEEAISKAEKEAKSYAKETNYKNQYGQNIRQRYLENIDVFKPYDPIQANVEVFSTTYIIDKGLSDEKLADNTFGENIINEQDLRKNFLNSEFSGVVA